jgi:hypothetical protein
MTWTSRTICLIALAGILVGCAGPNSSIAPPPLFRPGTAATQQNRALRYDPYPENEPGPAMVGVRPREYVKPIPEVDRARWQTPTDRQRNWQ